MKTTTRRCYKCKNHLPISEFYTNKSRRGGYASACKKCHKIECIETRYRNPETTYENKIKKEVFSHYSGGEPCCKRCGITDLRILTMDHINGNGYQHRKEIKKRGSSFYCWTKKNGYPNDLQILCHNCQWIKRIENFEHRGRKNKKPI